MAEYGGATGPAGTEYLVEDGLGAGQIILAPKVHTGNTRMCSERNGSAGRTELFQIAIGGRNRSIMKIWEIEGGVECDWGPKVLIDPSGIVTYEAPFLTAQVRYEKLGKNAIKLKISEVKRWENDLNEPVDEYDRLRISYITKAGLEHLGYRVEFDG